MAEAITGAGMSGGSGSFLIVQKFLSSHFLNWSRYKPSVMCLLKYHCKHCKYAFICLNMTFENFSRPGFLTFVILNDF